MTDNNETDSNVISFTRNENSTTEGDIDPTLVLEAAKSKLKSAIVIGWTNENNFYFAMSEGSIANNLMMIEAAKAKLIEYMMDEF